MEKTPCPLDDRGLPYVPLSVFEAHCGGVACGANLDISCPDRHHLLGKPKRFGSRVMKELAQIMTVKLPRCVHNEYHARYLPPPEPSRDVAVQIVRNNG